MCKGIESTELHMKFKVAGDKVFINYFAVQQTLKQNRLINVDTTFEMYNFYFYSK